MAEARLHKGGQQATVADYRPVAEVAAGTVVVVGDFPFIAHLKIEANKLGALACGGAIYQVVADAAIAAGKKVFWDDTAKKVTASAGANKVFGYVAPGNASTADGDVINVVHNPAV